MRHEDVSLQVVRGRKVVIALIAFDPGVGDQVYVSGGSVLEVDVLPAEGLRAKFTRRTRCNVFFGTLRHNLKVKVNKKLHDQMTFTQTRANDHLSITTAILRSLTELLFTIMSSKQ